MYPVKKEPVLGFSEPLMLQSNRKAYNLVDDDLVSEDGHVIDTWPSGSVDKVFLFPNPSAPSLQRPDVDGSIAITGDFVGLVI